MRGKRIFLNLTLIIPCIIQGACWQVCQEKMQCIKALVIFFGSLFHLFGEEWGAGKRGGVGRGNNNKEPSRRLHIEP